MRYQRQLSLPGIGDEGQNKISTARVAVVGIGGLGSAVLYYLAAAGVGTISLFDSDIVELSNFNRQIIYSEQDIGKRKVESAADRIRHFNSEITIKPHDVRITHYNALELLGEHDVIVSCVDNRRTRYLLVDIGLRFSIPLVEGGVEGFSGFQLNTKRGFACIGCLWGNEGNKKVDIPILGVTAGHIGIMQAAQTLEIIISPKSDRLFGKLWTSDLHQMSLETFPIDRNPDCPICGRFYS